MTGIDDEDLAAAIVHDMRSPLNACLMSLSLVELKVSQPAEVLKSVEVIRRNLERQALLITDLGDALEMMGGGLRLECEDADLVELAETAAEAVASNTGVRVGWAASRPQACPIHADPERLGRAIGTAIEIVAAGASASGRVELTVTRGHGGTRLDVQRNQAAGADSGARRKHSVMRQVVAREIVTRHGGSLQIDDRRATVELPQA